ncbi:hypothetical protein ABZ807_10540 [Micromonospora sp. NPDC047548]|uniref:hypothetical protein n=1 Tax=Micromonospora sp. NPDC047548 TaxID=3155624 RepID=UPI0034072DA4
MRTATASTAGWWARLLLFACTLLGLAAMHTIGHGTHSAASHPDDHVAAMSQRALVTSALPETVRVAPAALSEAVRVAAALVEAAPVAHAAAPVSFAGHLDGVAAGDDCAGDGCAGDGCPRAAPAELPAGAHPGGALALPAEPGDAPSGWSVCLAVLGAVTVALLLVALLLGRARPAVALRHSAGPSRGPRAPPPRPVGLRLATVSVLRR